jgi:hypothetical protein
MTRLRENTMKIQTTFEKRKVNLGANRWGTIGALALAAVVLATASVGGKSRRAASPQPTVANVAYDKHKLTQFDFWQAKGEGPRPLGAVYNSMFGDVLSDSNSDIETDGQSLSPHSTEQISDP